MTHFLSFGYQEFSLYMDKFTEKIKNIDSGLKNDSVPSFWAY